MYICKQSIIFPIPAATLFISKVYRQKFSVICGNYVKVFKARNEILLRFSISPFNIIIYWYLIQKIKVPLLVTETNYFDYSINSVWLQLKTDIIFNWSPSGLLVIYILYFVWEVPLKYFHTPKRLGKL